MRKTADVRSIAALRDAKAAIAEFREVTSVALSEAQSDVQRTLWWIQNDRRTFWQHELRRREEQVNQARSELYRAKLAAMDDRASCIVERKALEKAERRCEEARQKIEAVKRWARMLEREYMLYRGQVQGLARTVEVDLPRGEAQLEIMMDRLDAYLREQTPPSGRPPSAGRDAPDPKAKGGESA
ncbi:MAG: hypothetical protein HKO59_13840 [Phycisphaerales bacterium]|nr:hypothetical protein [Phycisphaerales bacterium]